MVVDLSGVLTPSSADGGSFHLQLPRACMRALAIFTAAPAQSNKPRVTSQRAVGTGTAAKHARLTDYTGGKLANDLIFDILLSSHHTMKVSKCTVITMPSRDADPIQI